jgi:hypothetical protein
MKNNGATSKQSASRKSEGISNSDDLLDLKEGTFQDIYFFSHLLFPSHPLTVTLSRSDGRNDPPTNITAHHYHVFFLQEQKNYFVPFIEIEGRRVKAD